jgi:hypothetical protein
MRARILDPAGPAWTRAAPIALGLLLAVLGAFGPGTATVRGVVFLVGMATLFVGPLFVGRQRTRDATLRLAPGAVTVTGAGRLNQTIRAAKVTAASTARVGDRVALALQRDGRANRPLVLEVASEVDAKALREALGIGFFGFGVLAWPTGPRPVDTWDAFARIVAGLAWIALALTIAADSPLLGYAIVAAVMTVPVALVVMLTTVASGTGPAVVLHSTGLFVRSWPLRQEFVPYAKITGVSAIDGAILLDIEGTPAPMIVATRRTRTHRGLSPDEREQVVAQVRCAAERARGAGDPPPTIAPRIADLARGDDEPRAWIARVDATAAQIASHRGYRGAGFEPAELWTTLEDPDAPSDVRAAAARILARVSPDETPARVERVLATVRDEPTRKRIRVALDDDVDALADALASLDESEGHGSSAARQK